MGNDEEKDIEGVDPSQYRPTKQARKVVREMTLMKQSPGGSPRGGSPRLMDIRTYLDEDEKELNLHPLQKNAFSRIHQGKILSYEEWKALIKNELTHRAE